jgi:hypothetical protein
MVELRLETMLHLVFSDYETSLFRQMGEKLQPLPGSLSALLLLARVPFFFH